MGFAEEGEVAIEVSVPGNCANSESSGGGKGCAGAQDRLHELLE